MVDAALPSWWEGFLERVADLERLIPEAIAERERETPISTVSLENCKAFASKLVDVARPATFIMNDGRARLVWQTGKVPGTRPFTEQVAIKFREDERVEFILFRTEVGGTDASTIMGDTHVDAILDIVSALGLDRIMAMR